MLTRFYDKNGKEIQEGDFVYHPLECIYDRVVWNDEFQYHLSANYGNTQSEMDEWVIVDEKDPETYSTIDEYDAFRENWFEKN